MLSKSCIGCRLKFAGNVSTKLFRIALSTATPKVDEMKDEYGAMDSSGETFEVSDFTLESGRILKKAQVRYSSFGSLNEKKDNVFVVCHALTGNARLDQWWGTMLGPGKTFDTSKYLVVCANVLGSCYGSSGPQSVNAESGLMFGNSFPEVTIRDTVNIHLRMVKEAIGASQVACVVGGSMGGMQALEWVLLGGSFVRTAIVIGCGARHTGWQIGISEVQRQAIFADPKWNGGDVDMRDPPTKGLSVARQIAMLSYRTARGFEKKFGREKDEAGQWQVKKYLEYQGSKFLTRFDPVSYVKLTHQMDSHDVGRGRGGVAAALGAVKAPVLVVGIDSDILYPLHEQEELVSLLPKGSELRVIRSPEGHDAFLLEQGQVASFISEFLGRLGGGSRNS